MCVVAQIGIWSLFKKISFSKFGIPFKHSCAYLCVYFHLDLDIQCIVVCSGAGSSAYLCPSHLAIIDYSLDHSKIGLQMSICNRTSFHTVVYLV